MAEILAQCYADIYSALALALLLSLCFDAVSILQGKE